MLAPDKACNKMSQVYPDPLTLSLFWMKKMDRNFTLQESLFQGLDYFRHTLAASFIVLAATGRACAFVKFLRS